MKENCLFFILIILIIFGCIFVKKEDQIREAFVGFKEGFGGFKEGFREGTQAACQAAEGRPCTNRLCGTCNTRGWVPTNGPNCGQVRVYPRDANQGPNLSCNWPAGLVGPYSGGTPTARAPTANTTQGRRFNVQIGNHPPGGTKTVRNVLPSTQAVRFLLNPGIPTPRQYPAAVANAQNAGWRDRFRVVQQGRHVLVTRLDARTGWGQNLILVAERAAQGTATAARPRPPPPPTTRAAATRTAATRAASTQGGSSVPGSCVTRDVVRVNGVWRNCCVRCKSPKYTALSTIGDGGRCLSCGIAPPPPPPRKCSSFSCPCGYMNNGEQQCADNNCTQTQCCSRIPKETIPNCISQLSWGRNCAKCDPQGWELSTVPKNAPRKEPPPPTPQPTCGSKTVPSPPPPDCFKQVAPDCKKIPMVPIKDCKKQRDWGKSCITCEVGYKMSSDKTRCDLIPIPFCKKQEREVCLECEESYRIGETGRTCEKIPKKHIPFCTNQRDWGAYCYECGSDQSGYMVSKNKEKCIPRPISNCKDQEGIRCNKCKFGYERSDNWKSCDIVPIKDCASQNKTICVECKQGYRLGEDRRKCDLLPIENCRERYEEFRTLGGFGKSRLFTNIS